MRIMAQVYFSIWTETINSTPLFLFRKKIIFGVEFIVAAHIENATVPLILTRACVDADNGTGSLAIFRPVGIAKHLEFGDGIHCGIYQDGAVRADVIIVHAVYKKQVVVVRISV